MEEGEGLKLPRMLEGPRFPKVRTGRSDRSDFKNEIRELSLMSVVNT